MLCREAVRHFFLLYRGAGRMHMAFRFLEDNLEAVLWTSALVWLALMDPAGGSHFSLCPLSALGFDWCPGCGLGRAASCVLRGDLAGSFHHHFLGIPAVVILVSRVVVLAKNSISKDHSYTQ
jgi:hypothetical protein